LKAITLKSQVTQLILPLLLDDFEADNELGKMTLIRGQGQSVNHFLSDDVSSSSFFHP